MNIKVKELIELLKRENPELDVDFSGLDFYRLKDRGGFLQIEFNQSVYKDSSGNVIIENN